MARLIFDLTDDDREALERIRIAMGARSHAEALRRLIREADAPAMADPPVSTPQRKAMQAARNRQAIQALGAMTPKVSVPFGGDVVRKPMQKKGK